MYVIRITKGSLVLHSHYRDLERNLDAFHEDMTDAVLEIVEISDTLETRYRHIDHEEVRRRLAEIKK